MLSAKGAFLYTRHNSLSATLRSWASLLITAGLAACGGATTNVGNTTTYAIGGSVSGLASGAVLVLQDNGSDNLSINADGTFTFATQLASGTAYSVSVLTQPAIQNCAVGNGSGAVTSAAVANVQVTCTPERYSISGTISPASNAAGAVVMLSGAASATATVDGSGNYIFTGLSPGDFIVTPTDPTATFMPPSQSVAIVSDNVGSVNFTTSATSNVIFFDDFTGTSLSSEWTVISRHGEYAQSETECNIPQEVSVANSLLTITTAVGPHTCGDFNVDGTVRHAPSSWPYITGDVQWRSLNFTYGTVTVRAKFPAQSTGLWPAIWLLGSNCQNTNPFTADVGYDTCPNLVSPSYAEIDMVECDLNNWCQLALANFANSGSGGSAFPTCGYPVDTNFHIFTLTWTASSVAVAVDGQPTNCSFSSPAWTIPSTPMFLIIQTQTGGAGGTPNDALLPANVQVDYVKVTQP